MKISNLQSHQRDSRHYSGPPSSLSLLHPWCRKSPGAPLHSAEVSPQPPKTQKQSHTKSKVLKSVQVHVSQTDTLSSELSIPTERYEGKEKGKKFMNAPYSQVTCYTPFLTFPQVSYCSG